MVIAAACTCAAGSSSAQTLSEVLPQLLTQGAVLAQPIDPADFTRVDPRAPDRSRSFFPSITLTTVPSALNSAFALQLSTATLGPTASTAIYSRDGRGPEMHAMFGSSFVDRGKPLGRGKVGLSMTFQNDDYRSFDGADINGGGINFLFANRGAAPGTSDVLQETVSMRINRKVTSFVFDFGVHDRFDFGAVVPIVQVAMDVRLAARVIRVRSSIEALQACLGGPPPRNAGNGEQLRLCQDAHGFDNVLTVGTRTTYLELDIQDTASLSNFGVSGKTARGVGDIQVRSKYALVNGTSGALAATVNLSLPTGDRDNFLGTGAYRVTPGIAFSAAAGRVSPHGSVGYTLSHGSLSSNLQAASPVPLDLKVPDQIDVAAGLDIAVAPRTTMIADFFGRMVRDVQRFAVGNTVFATGAPGVPVDVAAGTDFISAGRSNVTQLFGNIGGRIHLGGSVFANGSVMFPVIIDGLKPKPTGVFSIDYGF
jgi:hypothetical protein